MWDKIRLSKYQYIGIASAFLLFLNLYWFSQKMHGEMHEILKYSSIFISNYIFIFLLLLIFSFSTLVLKSAVVLFVLFSVISIYFTNQYGVSVDQYIIWSVIRTNIKEAGGWLSLKMLFYFMFGVVNSTIFVMFFEIKKESFNWKRAIFKVLKAIFISGSILLVLFSADPPQFRKSLKLNTPYIAPLNFVSAGSEFVRRNYFRGNRTSIKRDITNAHSFNYTNKEPTTVVLVIGESARADRFSLNGYSRDTTPKLKKIPNLISFTDAAACGTSTIVSIPCILSMHDGKDFSLPVKDTSLLSIFKKLGFKVSWISTQSNSYGLCSEVDECILDDDIIAKRIKNAEYDEALVGLMNKSIAEAPSARHLIILHTMGSHSPYYQRYTKSYEKYAPACNKSVYDCPSKEVDNAYDNTIAYTDYFLSEVIRGLRDKNAILFFTSDHGESLGEYGLYGHAIPIAIAPKAQTHVPFIMYMSDRFKKQNDSKYRSALSKKNAELSHDNIFHSMLDCANIDSDIVQKDKSICRF